MAQASDRPARVPAENVYNRLHWACIIALLAGIGALYLILSASGIINAGS